MLLQHTAPASRPISLIEFLSLPTTMLPFDSRQREHDATEVFSLAVQSCSHSVCRVNLPMTSVSWEAPADAFHRAAAIAM